MPTIFGMGTGSAFERACRRLGHWSRLRERLFTLLKSQNSRNSFESLHTNLVGDAALRCIEPNLNVVIRGDALGHVAVRVMITPDHMTQSHEFKFSLDQSYLGPLLDGCRNVLSSWPIRAVVLRKVEEHLHAMLPRRKRPMPIRPETELYRDLEIYGDALVFDVVLWAQREFGVEGTFRLADYAPGEMPTLFRLILKLAGKNKGQYKSLTVRDVVNAIETKRWPE